MISKQDQAAFRNTLFRHLDGIVTAPSAYALSEKGVCDFILTNKKVSLRTLSKHFNANEGYLNIALRVLCSQGWLTQEVDNGQDEIVYSINKASQVAFDHFYLYKDVVALLKLSEKYHSRKFEAEPFYALEAIFKRSKEHFGLKFSENKKTRSIKGY